MRCNRLDPQSLSVAAAQLPNGDVAAEASSSTSDVRTTTWKPVLLIIPLRLGLTEINPMYTESLKVRK